MHILYIHGFKSSARSFKAQLLKEYLADTPHQLFLPDLPHYPAPAMAILDEYVRRHRDQSLGFVGSSLGGYYATWLAERYRAPAVLINPAVRPYELLRPGMGMHENYHTGEIFELTAAHLRQLHDLELDELKHPENILLLTQTGDEVLDYRLGVERYRGSQQIVIEGGDHGFSDYADYLDQTVRFLEAHQTS